MAHWAMRAMNMQCLSPNTQVRWGQRPPEQQLPRWQVVYTVFTQCLVPGLGLANFMATLPCSTVASCGVQEQAWRA